MRRSVCAIFFCFVFAGGAILFAEDTDEADMFAKEFIGSLNKAESPKDAPDNRRPFGVLAFLPWNHPWNDYKYPEADLKLAVDLIKECGIGFVRMDFIWEDIEPQKGEYNFSKYDNIVNLLNNNGIEILGLLSYSATWAGERWNGPPDDNKTFVNYVSCVIQRYKYRIKYWEIWNEPDSDIYWYPQDDLARYSLLLKEVYTEAKRIDPDCKILNGGLCQSITVSLKNLYRSNAKEYFDILSIHPFVNPLNQGDADRLVGIYEACKKVMQDFNDDKKIWITELGCPGVLEPNTENAWWLGMSPTEKQQADWVKKVYTELIYKMPDCDKIFWAFFRDCRGYWGNGIDYFGLLRWNYYKKEAYHAYKECVKEWNIKKRQAPPYK